MSTVTRISKEELNSVKHVLDYCYEEERTHLEEIIYELNESVDYSELTDDDFYCAVNKLVLDVSITSHIWFSLYILNNLISKSK